MTRKEKMAKPTNGTIKRQSAKELVYSGFVYDVAEIADYLDTNGGKLKDAVAALHPDIPKQSILPICTKLKRHPYMLARKDASLALLKSQGPKLQQNMLDLAFNSRSEMVKYNATKDGLDRIFGAAEDTGGGNEQPTFVFNFNMGGKEPTAAERAESARKVIDGETVDQ